MKLKFLRLRLTVLGVFSTLSLGLFAQTDSLKDVVVSASRFEEPRLNAPTAVQVITQEDIKNSGSTSLPDVLQMLGGINVRSISAGQLGFNSAVDLGGFGPTAAQNTLILVDGRRLNPIDSSEVVWSGIPLSSIQRIEIAPGAAGVQYGAGSSGGVVHIVTDRKTPDSAQAKVQLGLFGTSLLDLSLSRQLGDLSVPVNAGTAKSNGWRENSQSDSQNVSVRLRKTLSSKAYVFGEAMVVNQSNGFAGGVVDKVGEGDQRTVKFNNVGSEGVIKQQVVRLGGFSALTDHTSFDADVVLAKKTNILKRPYFDTPDSFGSFFGVGYVTGASQISLDGNDVSFSPKFRTEFANGASLVYGYDFSTSKQNGAGTYGPLAQQVILANQGPFSYQGNIVSDEQSVSLRNHSLYAISRLPINAVWDISLGARRQMQGYGTTDRNKSGGSQASSGAFSANAYEAAVNFKLTDKSRTYLRVNQSYRFANTDEYWGFDPSGNRAFSGELRPQITKAYELGYDHKDTLQQVTVTFGQSMTKDEIRYDPAVYQNANLADDIFRTNVSINLSRQLLPKSRLTFGARYQRAEYAMGPYSGQTLGLVPKLIYNLGWTQDLDGQARAGHGDHRDASW